MSQLSGVEYTKSIFPDIKLLNIYGKICSQIPILKHSPLPIKMTCTFTNDSEFSYLFEHYFSAKAALQISRFVYPNFIFNISM